MDIEEREALKTYLLNLRHEIVQLVVASDPKNLNHAQQLAANKEQWLRKSNRVVYRQNQSKNQSNNTSPVFKRSATDLQPRGFNQPSDKKIPPRVYQTADPEETFQESTVPPSENYYQYYCDEKTEEESDISLMPEQE
ncbi:uncharacterized protein LOC122568776 [Bombus pyrosoma]|uniref:uncharacterized protein LOC122568776 n=1 Tax=Bombus pyrosoma TaxID=396416 RepID=UPI001CB9C629|nr:uncharacterized protein LOC122568776 [Bombus pyrosoma]